MKQFTHIIRYSIFGLMLCGALQSASAQDQSGATTARKGVERDPFVKYRPPVKAKSNKAIPVIVAPPSIQERIERYKAQKVAAMNMQQTAPKPTTALLLNEMQVMGIFRTPRGYAAMVEATPIKLSYVIYPGETFYDGQLVAIEENRLVFRHETRWTNGRREYAVETKPLRKPNPVSESLAETKEQKGNSAAADANANKEEKASAPEKQ